MSTTMTINIPPDRRKLYQIQLNPAKNTVSKPEMWLNMLSATNIHVYSGLNMSNATHCYESLVSPYQSHV